MKSLLVAPWTLTLTGLPRAGANSKPHHYKQKVEKMKDIPKTWVLRGNSSKISDEKKEQEHYSPPFKKTQWNTRTLKASIEQGVRKQ